MDHLRVLVLFHMKNKLLIAPLLFSTFFMASTGQASIRGLTKEQVVTDDEGKSFKQISVTCRNFSGTRTLRRPESGGKWCDTAVPGFCASQKVKAANRVCSKRYKDALVGTTKKPEVATDPISKPVVPTESPRRTELSPELTELEKEKIAIEQKRLQIEQRQMELEQREKELRKQKESLNGV